METDAINNKANKRDKRELIVCNNGTCQMFQIQIRPNEGVYYDHILERDLNFGENCFKCGSPYVVIKYVKNEGEK